MSDEPTKQPTNPVESMGLLACPFCGESTAKNESMTASGDRTSSYNFVRCGTCGATTNSFLYNDQAKNSWNTRAG